MQHRCCTNYYHQMEHIYTCGNIDPCSAFPEGYTVCRPIIYVRLRLDDIWTQPIVSVVDTGADYCTFFGNVAEELGLDFDSLPSAPTQGLGQSVVRVAPVDLDADVYGQWPIRAAFSPNSFPFALLGHVGFLDRLKFSTNPTKMVFTLEPIS